LSQGQTELLISGAIYTEGEGKPKISYTAFFKQLQKLDSPRLVDLIWVQAGGRTSEVVLGYEPAKAREM